MNLVVSGGSERFELVLPSSVRDSSWPVLGDAASNFCRDEHHRQRPLSSPPSPTHQQNKARTARSSPSLGIHGVEG